MGYSFAARGAGGGGPSWQAGSLTATLLAALLPQLLTAVAVTVLFTAEAG